MPNPVYLGDEDLEDGAGEVIKALCEAARLTNTPTLLISSGGGSLFEGLAVADAIVTLQYQGIKVRAHVLGCAFSAATFPLLVASKRTMTKFGWLGIHGMQDEMRGDMRELEVHQQFNRRLVEQQVQFYAAHSAHDEAYWRPLLQERHVHYYRADEALEAGLIDAIV